MGALARSGSHRDRHVRRPLARRGAGCAGARDAAGGGQRLLLAVALSAVIWWFIGQTVAARVSKRPVVGWREWAKEFAVLGLGLWIGAAGALIIGALALGGL